MAKQITTDEESSLQRQARRRLIGAVALVLVIVIVLPMVFDREPAPTTANDIELRIPDKETAPAFQPQAAVQPVETASAASAAPVVASAVASAASAAPMIAAAQAKPQSAESKIEPKAKTEPKVKTEAKAATKPVPTSGWVVQVGAYSNADTAKQLHAKLSKQGFHAYTEKAGGNVRVRVGSYPTRDAVEKVRHKLEAQGLHPNVVNLE